MKEKEAHIIVEVHPYEIVQLICEIAETERLDFDVEVAQELTPNALLGVTVLDFSETWTFIPPETGQISLYNYVAQKMESVPLRKKTVSAWLKAFQLEDEACIAVADLPRQAHLKLQLLISVLEQHQVVLILSSELLDNCDAILWRVKQFLLRLDNPVLQPAFVVCDTDVTPGMAFSVERLIVVENETVDTLFVAI